MNDPQLGNGDPGPGALAAMWASVDPVPSGLVARMQAVAAAEEALFTSDLDHELMLLVERSAELAGARGSAAYTLRFAYRDVDLLVRASGSNGVPNARLDGWVVPPGEISVRAQFLHGDRAEGHPGPGAQPGDDREAIVDGNGRFEFPELPTGLMRLWLIPADGTRPFATPVFEI